VAGCQVAPPSADTSTPPTCPPTSLAVPVTATCVPSTGCAPAAGEVMLAVGGVVSADAVAGCNPAIRVAGCTPMSANRFTVACCMLGSVGVPAKSCVSSSPHDHWIVPAPNTSAPLGCLYSVR
jgi:hypothetical protein